MSVTITFDLDSTAGRYRDGDYTVAAPCGPLLSEPDPQFVKEGDNGKYVFRQPYCQLAYLWEPQPLDSFGPYGSVLVAETVPRPIGCGIVEWERIWAIVPRTRTVLEDLVYNYQTTASDTSGTLQLVEIPKKIPTYLVRDYIHFPGASLGLTALADVPIVRAVKASQVGSLIVITPPDSTLPPTPNANGHICAEDTSVRIWMGNIIELSTRYADAQTIDPFKKPTTS